MVQNEIAHRQSEFRGWEERVMCILMLLIFQFLDESAGKSVGESEGATPIDKGNTSIPISSFSPPPSAESWDDSSKYCVLEMLCVCA